MRNKLMIQADSPDSTIPSRIQFASAGAVRRNRPIRQLPTGIQICFANLIDNLRAIDPPHLIVGIADETDLNERADHIEAVLKEVTAYVKAIVGDTRHNANVNINDETGGLEDATGDVIGALRNAAERMREFEADAAA